MATNLGPNIRLLLFRLGNEVQSFPLGACWQVSSQSLEFVAGGPELAPSVRHLEGKCCVATCLQVHCIMSASVELAERALCSLIDAVVPAACPDGQCRVSERVGVDRRTAPSCPVVLIAATVIHSITDQIPN